MRTVLGLSAFYHDSAACLLVEGRIAAAAQEERFTRVKHDERFPSQAVSYCLREAGITIDDVDVIGFYEKPLVKFERLLESYVASAPPVRRDDNPLYYDIIRAFGDLTGCPMTVNTSFNVRDEPIVCTPEDAHRCFMKTEMDVLVLESTIIEK